MAAGFNPQCDECLRLGKKTDATHYVRQIHRQAQWDGQWIVVLGLKMGYCAEHAPDEAKLIEFEEVSDEPFIVEGR